MVLEYTCILHRDFTDSLFSYFTQLGGTYIYIFTRCRVYSVVVVLFIATPLEKDRDRDRIECGDRVSLFRILQLQFQLQIANCKSQASRLVKTEFSYIPVYINQQGTHLVRTPLSIRAKYLWVPPCTSRYIGKAFSSRQMLPVYIMQKQRECVQRQWLQYISQILLIIGVIYSIYSHTCIFILCCNSRSRTDIRSTQEPGTCVV